MGITKHFLVVEVEQEDDTDTATIARIIDAETSKYGVHVRALTNGDLIEAFNDMAQGLRP